MSERWGGRTKPLLATQGVALSSVFLEASLQKVNFPRVEEFRASLYWMFLLLLIFVAPDTLTSR